MINQAKQEEANIINGFLDMCAESLDPDTMDNVRSAIADLCDTRHIDRLRIREWGLPYLES